MRNSLQIADHAENDKQPQQLLKSFHNNMLKQKISEALYIKQYPQSLNSQGQSVQSKLLN